jgi:hypothetical protein
MRSNQLAALLGNRQMLLIVDDVWDAAHAQPFLVGGADCRTLITTREPKVARDLGLPKQAIYKLLVLSEEVSLNLLREIAPTVVKEDLEGTRRLVNELNGLPLALHMAGSLLVAEAELGLGVGDLLEELAEGTRILEEEAPADRADLATQTTPTVATLFKRSTDRLDSVTREWFALSGVFASKPATFQLANLPRRHLVRRPLSAPGLQQGHGFVEGQGGDVLPLGCRVFTLAAGNQDAAVAAHLQHRLQIVGVLCPIQ